ncbi:peptide/nickel transport system ATP-binding protein [Actinocorallia herbida]|uniref:Peptide/nickel transport system ATP-binding protein n=1 Tax=Actinocorallia herbida TaxID=58109 RepID=A0A3N1CVY9_9ACTN|nr:ABC transporter ATP-binding protein [Actinocorallia herbida]ROO85405.1 peptide/nickel transport system ATP-binding protein [Actinocorallia herbida]
MTQPSDPVLEIGGLSVAFGGAEAVSDVSLTLERGRCLALVGESGSGKSVTARSVIGLAGARATVRAETLRVLGKDVLGLSARGLRELRGPSVGLVLQDALVSLDPLRPVGKEIGDALARHTRSTRAERRAKVVELLTSAGVPNPEQRAAQRSGELSGGLRQRALIASAIALDPPLLIADEPTTALDATVQEQILELLLSLKEAGTAVLLISHDLAVVNRIADDIAVMHHGKVVERGPAAQVLGDPRDDYTRRLIAAIPGDRPRGVPLSGPRLETAERTPPAPGSDAEIISATGLAKSYTGPDGVLKPVVEGVSFTLGRGRTLGLVGESGSGKTTTARMALGLVRPDAGELRLAGRPWSALTEPERRPERWRIGAIYQDPLGSFDPRHTVGQILADAVSRGRTTRAGQHRKEIEELLDAVGLPTSVVDRRPLRLSGGQRQRVAIARALAPRPELIVCDEPVSALDVLVQAQVLDLLDDLQRDLGLAYLFISHDLGVVQHVSDDVAVMSDGRIVESGPADRVFTAPEHTYTRRLLDAAPRLAGA